MDRTGFLHPEAIMDHGYPKAAMYASFTQTGAATDSGPKHLSAADNPRKKDCEYSQSFFIPPIYAFDLFSSREDAFLELPVCSCHVTHRDVATHTEEYAPEMKPISMTSAKFLVVSPPKK